MRPTLTIIFHKSSTEPSTNHCLQVVGLVRIRCCGSAGAASPANVKAAVKPAYNMAIPNGVRPQKAETAASPVDAAVADDSGSEADSAGWETASDGDTDSVSAQAPKAAATLRGKSAEAAGRLDEGTTASSSGQQSMDTSATDRAEQSSATSADEASTAQEFEEWDVCRSLFDNHVSASLESNLEYMFKHFGFYLPDAEYLSDPAGLIKYLVRT